MEYITDITQFGKIIDALISRPEYIGFDVESTGLDPINDTLLLTQLAIGDNIFVLDATRIPLREFTYLMELVEESKIKLVGQNAKFDMKFIANYTGVMFHNVYDTMTIEALITGGNERYASLKYLLKKYCNLDISKDVRLTFLEFDGNFTQEQLEYGADDVRYLADILKKQLEIIYSEKLNRVLELEMKLLPVVATMELAGVGFDAEGWNEIIKKNENSYVEKEYEIKNGLWKYINKNLLFDNFYELADYISIPVKTKKLTTILQNLKMDVNEAMETFFNLFNISSNKQIKGIFKLLGIELDSTGEKIISNYRKYNANDPIQEVFIDKLLEYRELAKKVSSYGDKFISQINPTTGRIHANFNQIGTRTGRFSSSNPNLQQVPRDIEYRQCFKAREDYVLITVDYSQQEYRLAGAVSGERAIIDAYLQGIDMHTITGCLIYGVSVEELTSEQRQVGKTMNFAILYGSSEYGLSKTLKISIDEARELISKFRVAYPILVAFIEEVQRNVLEKYYSVTPLGRRRYFEKKTSFDDIKEYERYQGMLKREGFNHVIQGGSADMIKMAINNIYYDNPFGIELLRTVMTVHDEVVVEVHNSIVEEGKEFILDCMKRAGEFFQGEVPVKSSALVLDTWSK